MLSRILQDSYPEVKKNTALFIIEISEKLKGSIGLHSQIIIKALASNLTHQHSKVRKVILEVIKMI
jgi:dynein assembly factor 5